MTSRIVSGVLTLIVLMTAAPTLSQAQTISIIKAADDTESMMVEMALKRNLRAEGYTVKGESMEGFNVWLGTMRAQSRSGNDIGVVGYVLIGSLRWQEFADSWISDECRQEHQLAEKVERLIGTKTINVGSTIAIGANSEEVAEVLSTFINSKVRAASLKAASFIDEVEKKNKHTGAAPSRQYQ